MQTNIVGTNASRLPSAARGGRGEVAGRAGEDAARVLAVTGGRTPEARSGSSVHVDSGLGNGSFVAAIHSDSSSSSCIYYYSCERLDNLLVSFIVVI